MSDYRSMSNLELIRAEDALDFRDPEILSEIFNRAEECEPGITDEYNRSFRHASMNSDDIFDRAVNYLLSEGDSE